MIPFSVNVDGVEYKCYRELEKVKKEYKQTITVEGVGFDYDADLYFEDYMRNGFMEFKAKQIAKNIILKRTTSNASK